MRLEQHPRTPVIILITIFVLLSGCENISVADPNIDASKAFTQNDSQRTDKDKKTHEDLTSTTPQTPPTSMAEKSAKDTDGEKDTTADDGEKGFEGEEDEEESREELVRARYLGKGASSNHEIPRHASPEGVCANVQMSFVKWAVSASNFPTFKEKLEEMEKNNEYLLDRRIIKCQQIQLCSSPKVKLGSLSKKGNINEVICLKIWLNKSLGCEYTISVDGKSRTLTAQSEKLFLVVNPTRKAGKHKFKIDITAFNKKTKQTTIDTRTATIEFLN